jgi:predicted regulator of Ras-like GTPase activity (Roadblock/LC7/MglB family)
MKNEIIAEIIADENIRFEHLLQEQKLIVQNFETALEKASSSNFELKTERLEEIITHWNEMFSKQKKAIQALNFDNLEQLKSENKKHQIFCYLFFAALIIVLIFNKI